MMVRQMLRDGVLYWGLVFFGIWTAMELYAGNAISPQSLSVMAVCSLAGGMLFGLVFHSFMQRFRPTRHKG